MKNSKKKIIIISAIILVIIIALVGVAAAAILTGKVAITSKQKLAKGFSDIGGKISISQLEENLKEYEKLQTTPFEAENTMTLSLNNVKIKEFGGMEEIINEVKKAINDTKITTSLKADLKNNVVEENVKVKLADIIAEISADVQYNKDSVALRSKEINEKYLSLTKSEAQSNGEYGELTETFDILDTFSKKDSNSLYLTNDEIKYFSDNYKNIFSNYIKDDMLAEQNATILVDGLSQKCSNVSFTLNKIQIQELVGEYLDKLQNDAEGKKIIANKIETIYSLIYNDYNKEDVITFVEELIKDLRNDLIYLDDDTTIKTSIYCSNFKTYGMDIEYKDSYDSAKISIILGNKTDELYLVVNGENVLDAKKINNEFMVNIKIDEVTAKLNTKNIDNKNVISFVIDDTYEEINLNVTAIIERLSKTESENNSKVTIDIALKEGDAIEVAGRINIDSSIKYVDSIDITNVDSSNSISISNASGEELQQYLNEADKNLGTIVSKAIQNSKLVQTLYNTYISYIINSQVVEQ